METIRTAHNKKSIPSREELVDLYHNKNMNILNISKHYGNVSNVTVKKWLLQYNIDLKSHKAIIKQTHKDRNYSAFNTQKTQDRVKDTLTQKYGVPYPPNNNTSKQEISILEFFNSLGYNMEKKRPFGIELDGYDAKAKIAFEYCGHYWHNENSPTPKNRNYHITKHNICQDNDIRLFTIFEHEWMEKRDQVCNFLKGTLGIHKTKLEARKCEIKVIDKKDHEVIAFLNKYHIQSAPHTYTNAVVLHYNNDILGVITLGKHHRQGQDNVLVLSRLCWKEDITVTGGTTRMFSYVPRDKTIVTWSDNRWSPGDVYKRLGFVCEKEYGPSYIYVSGKKWKNKQSFQKRYIGAGENQTEHERAYELGYSRMWDCGMKKWSYTP